VTAPESGGPIRLGPPQRPRTADECLADAEMNLLQACKTCIDDRERVTAALVGIGHALVAQVRQQGEFYREVADLLATARSDTPEA